VAAVVFVARKRRRLLRKERHKSRNKRCIPRDEGELATFSKTSLSERWRRVANFVDPSLLKERSSIPPRRIPALNRSRGLGGYVLRILDHGQLLTRREIYLLHKRKEVRTTTVVKRITETLFKCLARRTRHESFPKWERDRLTSCPRGPKVPDYACEGGKTAEAVTFLPW